MPIIIIMDGGHPAPSGPALPNLINAVRMSKSKPPCFGFAEINKLTLTLILTY